MLKPGSTNYQSQNNFQIPSDSQRKRTLSKHLTVPVKGFNSYRASPQKRFSVKVEEDIKSKLLSISNSPKNYLNKL